MIDFVARRTGKRIKHHFSRLWCTQIVSLSLCIVPSKTSSEVAAIALGIKRALFIVPPSQRRLVLIISDSEFALDFYCSNSDATARNDQRQEYVRQRTRTRTERLREDSFRRCLLSLINETPNGVLFTRVRSSSRGVEFVGVDRADEFGESPSSWHGIGFIDVSLYQIVNRYYVKNMNTYPQSHLLKHDAADHLSSIARSYANSNHGEGGEIKTLLQAKSLGKKDIAWLENSETVNDANRGKSSSPIKLCDTLSWQSIEVVGSEMRVNRKERNQQRKKIIEKFLGIDDSS